MAGEREQAVRDYPPKYVTEFRQEGRNDLADLYSYVWSRLLHLSVAEERVLSGVLRGGNETVFSLLIRAKTIEKTNRTQALAVLEDFRNRYLKISAEKYPKVDQMGSIDHLNPDKPKNKE